MVPDAEAAAGPAEIRLALPCMDQYHGHFGLMSVTLPDHFRGGAELASRTIDSGGGAQPAQFEFKDRGRTALGEGNRIQFTETVASAKVIAQFGVLVAKDASVPEFEVTGEEGTDTELRGGADDGEGGRLDADLAGAFPFPAAADSKPLRPAQVFAVAGVDELRSAVVRHGGGGVGIQRGGFMVFWRRPHSRVRRCRESRQGFLPRTILRRRRIFGVQPKPAGKDRFHSAEGHQ